MKRKLNIKDMAQKAGVSVATISRALHPETRSRVASKTLKNIDGLIEKYAYAPSLAASQLRRSSTKTIGVVFPYVQNIFYSSYYTHILSGISNYLMNTEYQFKILLLRQGAEPLNTFNFKAQEGIDGVIMTQWFRFFSKKFMTKGLNVPCVVINDHEKGLKAKFICSDNASGGKAAAEHLFSRGHRRMAVVAGASWSRDSEERVRGFQEGLKTCGVAFDQRSIFQGDWDVDETTHRCVDALLKQDPKVTAIFCCNDNLAFMVIERLKMLGIKCPEDISVIGFDDDFRAAGFSPALTTLRMPVYGLAEEAARSLIDHLRAGSSGKERPFVGQALLPVSLIERSSVKKMDIKLREKN